VTAGFIRDKFGNEATTDVRANGTIRYSDGTAPTIDPEVGFTSSKTNGSYKSEDTIEIMANMSEKVIAGSSFTVTLGTTDTVTLSTDELSKTLKGTYVVSSADSSSDLAIASFVVGTVKDIYGNTMTSTSIPSGYNLSDNKDIVIDNIPVAKNGNILISQTDNGNSTADATDVLAMKFTETIGNKSIVENFFANDVFGASGTRASTEWSSNSRELSVTLGVGESFSVSDAITLNNVEDLAGNVSSLTF
jgi:hypothetical protein